MNPLEHLWELTGSHINRYAILRLSDLKREIENAWYSIPKEVCENLIGTMERRL